MFDNPLHSRDINMLRALQQAIGRRAQPPGSRLPCPARPHAEQVLFQLAFVPNTAEAVVKEHESRRASRAHRWLLVYCPRLVVAKGIPAVKMPGVQNVRPGDAH